MILNKPVILKPILVSRLSSIIPFSVFEKPGLSLMLSSHSSRHGRNNSVSHCTCRDDNCKCIHCSHCHMNVALVQYTQNHTHTHTHTHTQINVATLSFQSVPDLYGDLKGFRDRFPADKLEQLRQSRNLSNISAK